jgi:hypothetical protein
MKLPTERGPYVPKRPWLSLPQSSAIANSRRYRVGRRRAARYDLSNNRGTGRLSALLKGKGAVVGTRALRLANDARSPRQQRRAQSARRSGLVGRYGLWSSTQEAPTLIMNSSPRSTGNNRVFLCGPSRTGTPFSAQSRERVRPTRRFEESAFELLVPVRQAKLSRSCR